MVSGLPPFHTNEFSGAAEPASLAWVRDRAEQVTLTMKSHYARTVIYGGANIV